jgi:hypothetical protein
VLDLPQLMVRWSETDSEQRIGTIVFAPDGRRLACLGSDSTLHDAVAARVSSSCWLAAASGSRRSARGGGARPVRAMAAGEYLLGRAAHSLALRDRHVPTGRRHRIARCHCADAATNGNGDIQCSHFLEWT